MTGAPVSAVRSEDTSQRPTIPGISSMVSPGYYSHYSADYYQYYNQTSSYYQQQLPPIAPQSLSDMVNLYNSYIKQNPSKPQLEEGVLLNSGKEIADTKEINHQDQDKQKVLEAQELKQERREPKGPAALEQKSDTGPKKLLVKEYEVIRGRSPFTQPELIIKQMHPEPLRDPSLIVPVRTEIKLESAIMYDPVASVRNEVLEDSGVRDDDDDEHLTDSSQSDSEGDHKRQKTNNGAVKTSDKRKSKPFQIVRPNATPGPTADRPFPCTHRKCNWSFARLSDLKRHVKSHEPPQFQCPYWRNDPTCHRNGGAFNRLDVLKRHLRLVHYVQDRDQIPRKIKIEAGWCRSCQNPFTTIRDFLSHVDACSSKLNPTEWRHRYEWKRHFSTENGEEQETDSQDFTNV